MIKTIVKNITTAKSLPVYLVVIITAFIFFWGYELFSLVFGTGNQNFAIQALSAFSGAFFAFLFLRLADFLERYYLQQKRHYNALVSLEVLLDEIGAIIHDNLYLLPSFRQVITSGNIYASLLKTVPLERKYYDKLHDIKLINDVYKLNYDIRRINDDIENSNNWYANLRDLFTHKQIGPEDYITNSKIIAQNLKFIEAGLKLLLEDNIKLHARVTLRADMDKPLLTKIIHGLLDLQRSDLADDMINAKVAEIKSDISNSGQESKPRIEKLIEEANKIE